MSSAVSAVLTGLDAIADDQEELYKHVHSHPELSFQETETVAEITRRLESYGYDVRAIGGGVVGTLANGDGPTVLFRADIDALPVKEDTGLDYASTRTVTDDDGRTVPVMHACGHDVHIVAGLGAAQLLAEGKEHWHGTYVALFQPAEEVAGGARSMVNDGLVEALGTVDVALGQHVLAQPVAGNVAVNAGPTLSTATSLRITVFGKGSHGSMPHLGVDPVLIASTVVVRLQSIVARELAPGQFGVVTVGSLQAGTTSNVIPASATLLVNVRAYDEETRDRITQAIERIVRAECEGARSPQEPTFEYYDAYPLTDNDSDATDVVRQAFVEHFGQDRVQEMGRATASEDFSIVPGAFGAPYTYWGLGGFAEGQTPVANHNPGFAPVIQPTLRTGAEAAVTAVLAYLA